MRKSLEEEEEQEERLGFENTHGSVAVMVGRVTLPSLTSLRVILRLVQIRPSQPRSSPALTTPSTATGQSDSVQSRLRHRRVPAARDLPDWAMLQPLRVLSSSLTNMTAAPLHLSGNKYLARTVSYGTGGI